MIDVRVLADPDSLAAAVADAFVELVRTTPVVEHGAVVHEVALTGGTIARLVHRAMAARREDVSWSAVRFWWGDERFVDVSSPDRNAVQAHEDLLNTLLVADLPSDNVMEVPPTGSVRDVAAAAEVYADLIRQEGTGEFAVVMLGIGPDGHVASLFPGHPALTATDAITVAVPDSPKPPPERVSLTFEALNRSRHVWFLASGAEKAEAVARSVTAQRAGAGSIEETPAYGIGHPDQLRPGAPAPQITWWLDEAAASALP